LTGNLGGAFWEFTVGGYSVGSGKTVKRKMIFIADTGTSLLITDDAVVEAFYAPIAQAAYSSTYGGTNLTSSWRE
jgi:aspergillopepsin I